MLYQHVECKNHGFSIRGSLKDIIMEEWKNQVISFIKEKDKLLNPDKYTDEQPSKKTKLNLNFFDDESDDNSLHDSDSDQSSGNASPVIQRRQLFPDDTQSLDYSSSINPESTVDDSTNPPKSNAEIREKLLDDEYCREQYNITQLMIISHLNISDIIAD